MPVIEADRDVLDALDAKLSGMYEHLCYLRDVAGVSHFSREAQPFADGKTFYRLTIELEAVPFQITQTQRMLMSMFGRALDRWEDGQVELPFDGATLNFNLEIDAWKAANPAPRMHSTPEWDAHGRVQAITPEFEL